VIQLVQILLLELVHVITLAQFAILVQLLQITSDDKVHGFATYVFDEQVLQLVHKLAPVLELNVLDGQLLQLLCPTAFWNVPILHFEHILDPLFDEKVPLGHIVQPHKLTFDTPIFGFELNL
jgi:hypothetical protein